MLTGEVINNHQSFYTQVRATKKLIWNRFGLRWEELVHRMNTHTLTVQSWLSSRSPQSRRFIGKGITATSTGLKVPLLNLALSSRFPPDTEDKAIAYEIEQVKRFFLQRQVPFTWWLDPLATPYDMDQRLQKHGFKLGLYLLPTLTAPLKSSSIEGPLINPTIWVRPVETITDLKRASMIRRIAFGFAKGAALTYFEDMADDWLEGHPARLFMAHLDKDGPPMAIGSLIIGAGLPGVYIMATLPQAERQGLGRAILARLLSTAASEGHEMIILTSEARAYSLYRKFGFEHIFEYEQYRLPAQTHTQRLIQQILQS